MTTPPTMGEEKKRAPSKRKPASTPFDNPWLLPILLWVGALWFGYDGWFNPSIKAVTFNRVGAPVLALGALWFTFTTLRDARRAKHRQGAGAPPARP